MAVIIIIETISIFNMNNNILRKKTPINESIELKTWIIKF